MTDHRPTIALTLLLLLAGCGDSGSAPLATPEVPAAAGPAAPLSGPARIEFTSTTLAFEPFPETETRSGQFEFVNAGGSPLLIRSVKPTCGCTAVSPSKTSYAPGEHGTIDVTFDPTAPGDQKKYVDVVSNSADHPTIRLMVTADVRAFIEVEPRILELDVLDYGRRHEAAVAVSCPDEDFVIQSVHATNGAISARVLGPDEARRYPVAEAFPHAKVVAVEISPDAPWGGLFSWLEITVRGRPSPGAAAITYTSKIRVQGKLFGSISAEPDTFRFGVDPNETFERRLTLQDRLGEPFELLEASVTRTTLPAADVVVEKLAEGRYELILTARGGSIPSRYEGVVTVRTDVPGEETIEIPILGIVRGTVPGG